MRTNNSYMDKEDLECLLAVIAQRRPRSILELGTHAGRTAAHILVRFNFITSYVGVDLIESDHPYQIRDRITKFKPGQECTDPRYTVFTAKDGSRSYVPKEMVDFIIIDGDHSYEGVQNDTFLAVLFGATGGYVMWHDVKDRIISRYLKDQKHFQLQYYNRTNWAGACL